MVHHSRISILPDADIQAPMLPPVAPGIAFTNPFQTVQEEEKSPTLKASGKPIQSSRSVDDMLSFDQAQTITAYLNAVKRIGFGTYLPKATSKPTITSTNTVKYPAVKRKPPPPYAPSLADPVVLPPPLYPAAAVSDRERQWRSVLPSSVDSPPCRMPKVVPASHMSYKTAPCRHWTKNNGWCPLGDRCGFIHDDNLKWIPAQATGPGEPTSSSASSNDSEDGEIRYPTRKYKTSHCWAYVQGSCSVDDCPYIHPKNTAPYIPYTPCLTWPACIRGTSCPFKHPPPGTTGQIKDAASGASFQLQEHDGTVYYVPYMRVPGPQTINGVVYYPLPLSVFAASAVQGNCSSIPGAQTLADANPGFLSVTPPQSVANPVKVSAPSTVALNIASIRDDLPVLPSRAVNMMAEQPVKTSARRMSDAPIRKLSVHRVPVPPYQTHTRHASDLAAPSRLVNESGQLPVHREEAAFPVHPEVRARDLSDARHIMPPVAEDLPAFPHYVTSVNSLTGPRNARGHARRVSVSVKGDLDAVINNADSISQATARHERNKSWSAFTHLGSRF